MTVGRKKTICIRFLACVYDVLQLEWGRLGLVYTARYCGSELNLGETRGMHGLSPKWQHNTRLENVEEHENNRNTRITTLGAQYFYFKNEKMEFCWLPIIQNNDQCACF